MDTVLTILAIALWMALGAAIALGVAYAAIVRRGRRAWKEASTGGSAMFGWWLDRPCSVQLKGKWTDGWSVVAVSHKGAVAVRRDGAKRAKWIPKEDVPERVRWTVSGVSDGSEDAETVSE